MNIDYLIGVTFLERWLFDIFGSRIQCGNIYAIQLRCNFFYFRTCSLKVAQHYKICLILCYNSCSFCVFEQPDVPRHPRVDIRSRPERHVLRASRLRSRRPTALEVHERRLGVGRQGWTFPHSHRLRPPGLSQLRLPLDEGARLLQQGETHEQDARHWTGEFKAELPEGSWATVGLNLEAPFCKLISGLTRMEPVTTGQSYKCHKTKVLFKCSQLMF